MPPDYRSPPRNDYRKKPVGTGRRVFGRSPATATKRKKFCMRDLPKPSVILMAEDDADDRLLVKDALNECQCGADLQFVENGEELLDYLLKRGKYAATKTTRQPGLIILDLNMPCKDGREALREIKT